MTPLFTALLWCFVQVTLLSTVAGVLYLLVCRFSSSASSALLAWSLGLVLTLTLLVASPWPRWQWSVAGEAVHSPGGVTASSDTEPIERAPAEVDPDLLSPPVAAWRAFTQAIASPSGKIVTGDPIPWASAPRLFVAFMGALLALSTARLVWGVRHIKALLRRSVAVTDGRLLRTVEQLREKLPGAPAVELRESEEIATPATVGWRKPCILLQPAWREWSEDETRAALAHELSHVASRDYLSWLVARLAVAVHFYHPVVRWLAGRLQLEQELAADAAAARLVGDRGRYLRSLASLALATPPHRLAGPARTLIPSRSLLMRRVEMLRAKKTTGAPAGNRLSGALVGLLIVAALGIAGLRQPQESFAQESDSVPVYDVYFEPAERIPLGVVPPGSSYVISLQPAVIFAEENLADLREEANALPVLKLWGVSAKDVAEVLIVAPVHRGTPPRRVVRFVSVEKREKALAAIMQTPGLERSTLPGNLPSWRDNREQITQIDELTIVFDNHPGQEEPPAFDNTPDAQRREWEAAWREREGHPLLAMIDLAAMRRVLSPGDRAQLLGGIPLQAVAPVLEQTDWVVGSLGIDDRLAMSAVAQCASEEDAARAAEIVAAMMTLGRGVVEQQEAASLRMAETLTGDEAAKIGPLVEKIYGVAKDFLASARPLAEGDRLKLVYSNDAVSAQDATLTAMTLPAIKAAQHAARRTQSVNDLKQLSLAMLNYENVHGHFPAAQNYEYYDRNEERIKRAKHPHSWRVAILPYVEEQALYDAYNFNEPWDSPANKRIAETVVPVFQTPFDEASSNRTSYFVLAGPGTVFDGEEGTRLRDIRDGTSNTVLLVEAKRGVPWAKPEDIPYAADKPLPELGGWMPGIFLSARCDGSAHVISQDVDEEVMRKLISKADGEAFEQSERDQLSRYNAENR